jgi:glycosyltransferase involved in cell wall biosynthesis
MRLVVATPLYPPEPGGPATYAKLLEDGLPAFGIDVEVIKFSDIVHFDSGIRHLAFFWRVFKAGLHADAIYALDPVSVGLPAMLAAKLLFKPFALKVVGDFAWEQGRQRFSINSSLDDFVRTKNIPLSLQPLRFIQTLVARSAKKVIVPSQYLELIVAEWGVRRQKISVVWNAVDISRLGIAPKELTSLPQPRVIAVGRLVPWKGFFELIEALQVLRNNRIYASLAIVGDGPDRYALEEKARDVLKQGYLLSGSLGHEDTLAAIAACDVFVLDSSYEGLSHTLIEALSLGMAVVASNIGGNREVVENEKNGLLVAPGSASNLAVAIERLIKDEALNKTLRKNAQAAKQLFSKETMLQKTASQLLSLTKR